MSSPSARFFEKSSARFSKMATRLVSRSTYLLAGAKLRGFVEVGEIGQLVGTGQRGDDLLVDLVTDVARALERDHPGEAAADHRYAKTAISATSDSTRLVVDRHSISVAIEQERCSQRTVLSPLLQTR